MAQEGVIERDRGILTEKDRKYLCGEIDLSDYDDPNNQEAQFRYRIRKRVENAIKDFAILRETLPRDERQTIFQDVSDFVDGSEAKLGHERQIEALDSLDRPLLLQGAEDAFQFIFAALMESTRIPPIGMVVDNLKYTFQLDGAIYSNHFYFGDVTIEIDNLDEHSISMDAASDHLHEHLLEKHETIDLDDEDVFSSYLDFLNSMPDMSLDDVITLIYALYQTRRICESGFKQLRRGLFELRTEARNTILQEEVDSLGE